MATKVSGALPPHERVAVRHSGGGRLMTKQDASGGTAGDLMRRWINRGTVVLPSQVPTYGDFTGLDDFHTVMNRIKAAEAEFLALPAAVRKACDNDPGKFLEMVNDPNPDQVEKLKELGLVEGRIPDSSPSKPSPEESGASPTPNPEGTE